jgi:hypothetical protein
VITVIQQVCDETQLSKMEFSNDRDLDLYDDSDTEVCDGTELQLDMLTR